MSCSRPVPSLKRRCDLVPGSAPRDGAPHPRWGRPDPCCGWALALLGLGLLAGCDDSAPAGPLAPGSESEAATAGEVVGELGEANDPGSITLRRLNSTEYNNTVRDLLGTSLTPADEFPSDDTGYGFDNIADVLSTSPLLAEMFVQAAANVAEDVLAVSSIAPVTLDFEAESLEGTGGGAGGSVYNLWSRGSVSAPLQLEFAGEYRISVRAGCQLAGPDPCLMSVVVDDVKLEDIPVESPADEGAVYTVMVQLSAGQHLLQLGFENDYYVEGEGDRNLLLDWVEVVGPLGLQGEASPARDALVSCTPGPDGGEACALQTLGSFLPRAYRRPVSDSELEALMGLFRAVLEDGGSFDEGLVQAFTAALSSPHFLFHVELDPDPDSGTPHPLDDHALASRLSYFLWDSMPDDLLFERAREGTLQQDATLRGELTRMLADERSASFVESFTGQWLRLRSLAQHEPDYLFFPDYDTELGASMRRETELLFEHLLSGEDSFLDLLDASYGFLDERLARHYGVSESGASGFGRVDLSSAVRRGLLGQGSFLTLTSYPTRTSPVRRGKFVLEQLLCSPPSPPPPGVEGLDQDVSGESGSLREQLEAHRANPSCAVCHKSMDPIGLGLENFDGVGAWRDQDESGYDIDASSELETGQAFDGPLELASALREDPRFAGCVVEKLFTYGLGRAPELEDQALIDTLTARFVASGHRFGALVESFVLSVPFRNRGGGASSGSGPPLNTAAEGGEL